MDLTEDQFPIWLGAYHDAEGYSDWHGTTRVAITSTHRKTLDMIQKRVGGRVRTLSKVARQRKPRYQLCITGPVARAFLVLIRPYVLEKAAQIDLILGLSTPRRRRRLTPAEWEHRADVRRQLKALRHQPS